MPAEPRVVIVTGGAYGIGNSIVRRFSAAGDHVIIADIDTTRGENLAAAVPNCAFQRTDVRNEGNIQELIASTVSRFGGVDVLCSNAGIERYRRADEYTPEDWSSIVDTNLRAAFLLVKYAFRHLQERNGSVTLISSVQAIANEKHISVYAGSKAGLLGLMRGMAVDFAPLGVRVNAVCPGAIFTGMTEAALASEADPAAALERWAQAIPLRRIGKPADIAEAVFFLASEQASYITGTQLVVDGGVLASLAL